jgi:hypothetical protein
LRFRVFRPPRQTRTNVTGSVTLTARTLNSICVEPILALEQRAKQRRNLPMMISLGAWRKRAGRAQNAAPMLKQFRLAVGRSMHWQHASNRRHGKHLFAFHSPVIPVSKRVCHFEFRVADQYGSLSKTMIALNCSKPTASCGELPASSTPPCTTAFAV